MAALLTALLIAACSGGGSQPAASGARTNPSPHVNVASPSPLAASNYWVLATLGLNLHQQPDRASPVVAVIRPGAQLDATEHRSGWIHVHADSQPDLDGWVVDDPLLLTTTPVQQDGSQALHFTILIPKDWTSITEADPSHLAAWQGPGGKPQLVVEEADSVDHLAKPQGTATRQEGPIEVFGKTVFITYYSFNGATDLVVDVDWAPGRAYRFSENAAGDSAVFKQLLASVVIT